MDSVTSCTQGGWGYGKKKGKKRVCLLELVQFLLSFFGQNSNNSLKADLLLRLAAASGGRGNCGRHRQQLMMKSGLLEWEPCYRKCHWKYCWPWQIKYRVSQLNYIRCVTHRRGRAGGFFNNGPWVINTLVLLCLRDLFFFCWHLSSLLFGDTWFVSGWSGSESTSGLKPRQLTSQSDEFPPFAFNPADTEKLRFLIKKITE